MKKNEIINQRIAALREEMKKHQIDAYIIPDKDPHLSEIPPLHWQSRTWISGFTGSQGTVVITQNKAYLWTDSRYFIQAAKEIKDTEYILCKEGIKGTLTPLELIRNTLNKNQKIGLDGTLFSINQIEQWQNVLTEKGIAINTSLDLFNVLWTERPPISTLPIFIYPMEYSGMDSQTKIKQIQEKLKQNNAEALIASALDEIAWCLNLRGKDIAYTPVFISYLLITLDRVILFIDSEKVSKEIQSYIREIGVEAIPYSETFDFIKGNTLFSSILLDKQTTNYTLFKSLPTGTEIKTANNPIPLLKAIRNKTEQQGLRQAMIKDGVALIKFLIWLEQNKDSGRESEISIAEKLLNYRKGQNQFVSESFSTIAGYKQNGAIVHYSATQESNTMIEPQGFILIDSGAQYLDGTTDITRTIALGELSEEEKRDYTLILKGHIALASAVFPAGTRGTQLDILARLPLWENKLNYLHGTGHGVGHFLSVHEGPQSIRMNENPTTIQPGMVISNEPGVYKENSHGIRTENLMLVCEGEEGMFSDYLHFETVTLCPICTKGIIKSMLTHQEIDWLNTYHQKVYNKLHNFLTKEEQDWLKEATKAI